MTKIKWKYDKKFKQWYALETKPFENDGFTITTHRRSPKEVRYVLNRDGSITSDWFRKLSSAKKVAELIKYG